MEVVRALAGHVPADFYLDSRFAIFEFQRENVRFPGAFPTCVQRTQHVTSSVCEYLDAVPRHLLRRGIKINACDLVFFLLLFLTRALHA